MSDVKVPDIRVYRFWSEYAPDKHDPSKMVEIDWIEYGNIADDKTKIIARVSQLRDHLIPMADAAGDQAVMMAHMRWSMIKPQYDAWKAGQEMPEAGTPLAAWNAITAGQAGVFKQNGIRTVEEIAAFTDAHIQRFGDKVPRLRDLVVQARAFIEAGDQTRIARSIEQRDEEIRALREENEEQRETVRELLNKVNALADMVAQSRSDESVDEDDPPVKRRPGRPPKNPQPEAAA